MPVKGLKVKVPSNVQYYPDTCETWPEPNYKIQCFFASSFSPKVRKLSLLNFLDSEKLGNLIIQGVPINLD